MLYGTFDGRTQNRRICLRLLLKLNSYPGPITVPDSVHHVHVERNIFSKG